MKVLIIGGNNELGIGLCNYFVSKGDQVVCTYHDKIVRCDKVEMVRCDVRVDSDIENVIKNSILKMGTIDILINMAAISMDSLLCDIDREDLKEVLNVNTISMLICNKIYCKYISNGMIVNIGSSDGIDTYNEYNLGYAISKSAIITMSKAISMVSSNQVVCICPNWIDTDSTRSIDKTYLVNELKRINQSRLISVDELVLVIGNIINNGFKSGSVYRIDVKDDKLWIEMC